ncbi:MAG: hypothetical protein EHM78_22440 [Myxococcaceae bacterium]|nr:MAG: hypothetical protein EHM78_22440 [Myxococcaceae bacterium]
MVSSRKLTDDSGPYTPLFVGLIVGAGASGSCIENKRKYDRVRQTLDDEPPQTVGASPQGERNTTEGTVLTEELMRAGIGPIFLIVALFGCHSKTKATADLLASLDTELSRTEVEVQKCLRALDERSEILARQLSLLHDTHQRTMFRNYANVVPLVRAEGHARKSFDAFFNQQRRCQELVSHGVALRERLVATITLNVGSVPQAWLARSAWFEKDLVAAKSRASDLAVEVTKLLSQADSEFDQVKVLRSRGCIILENCGEIQRADVLVAAEGEAGTVTPLSAKGL